MGVAVLGGECFESDTEVGGAVFVASIGRKVAGRFGEIGWI